MSDGLKTGLILGGAGLVAFLLYQRSQTPGVSVGVGAGPAAGSTLAPSPGGPGAAAAAAAPPTASSSSGGHSTASTVGHYVALAAIAPIVYPTKAVVYGAKAVGSAVAGAFESIF